MGLQTEAIDNRLEGLEQADRRVTFDTKLRAFRLDDKEDAISGNRTAKAARMTEGQYPVDQVVALIEALSRMIDGLEKKDRALGEEIRLRARQDRRRRSAVLAVEIIGVSIFIALWMMNLI